MVLIEVDGLTTKVIDCHNHWGLDKGGEVREYPLEEVLNALGNIDKTFLFSSNSPAPGPRGFVSSLDILNLSKETEKVVPFYRLDLGDVKGCKFHHLCNDKKCAIGKEYEICDLSLEELLKKVKDLGFQGLKVHMRASMEDYSIVGIDDQLVKNIAFACDKAGIKFLLIHTHDFEMVSQFFRLSEMVLPRTTDVSLICAHSGGGLTKRERRLCRRFVGKRLNHYIQKGHKGLGGMVYKTVMKSGEWTNRMLFDTSNVYGKYLLEGLLLCKEEGKDFKKTEESEFNINNIVYGTDWPFVKDKMPKEKAENVIKELLGAGFSGEEIEKVMCKNIESKF